MAAALFLLIVVFPPLVVVVCAWHTALTVARPARFIFKNRCAGNGIAAMVFLAVVVGSARLGYGYGNCVDGLKAPATCTRLDNGLGDLLFQVDFLGGLYLVFAGLPTILLLGVAEIITRIRHLTKSG